MGDFKVFFPPAYKRKIWDFSKADSQAIRRALGNIDWERVFTGMNIDEKVTYLSDCVLNVFSNLVPNKIVTVRDKDAIWMTPEIKKLILEKAKIYKRFVKNGRHDLDKQALREVTFRCTSAIRNAKKSYFEKLGNTLNDPNIGSKRYWSILNKFLHKRKIPKIPPIRDERNVLVSDTSKKASIFNSFFAKQCTLIDTESVLPPETFVTNSRLDSIFFDEAKILNLINSLDANKAHGWDEISTRMVKLCGDSLVKPLMIIFQSSINSEIFPSQWKKGNIVPVHKKGDKSVAKNYRPVSLLPLFGKIFEKCIYDTLYNYFETNSLFTPCQSGFREGDSCLAQLLSITHDIFKGFDANPSMDTRGVFLDISKAFDRVWHESLIYKLKSCGVSGSLLGLLKNFLSDSPIQKYLPMTHLYFHL